MIVSGVNGVSSEQSSTQQINPSSLGKEDFLQLLITQLEYQDPLSPLDNEDLIAQLAQFSSLEELHNINESLSTSIDLDLVLTQVLNNTAAAGLIGKSVVAKGDQIGLKEGEANIVFDLQAQATRVVVSIYDENGVLVRTIEEGGKTKGRNTIRWDGKDNKGNALPEGTYSFEVQAFDAEGNEVDVTPLVTGLVTGVNFKDGEAFLSVGGVEIGISEIIEISLSNSNQEGR